MAIWCRNCKGSYPNYWCANTNNYISSKRVEEYCKYDGVWYKDGKTKCTDYYVSTITGIILKKEKNDDVLDSIKVLREEYLEKDENYSDLLEMYDYIGPVVASKLDEDKNKVETATKVYKILARISKLVEKEEIDKATGYYSQMVGVLIKKYDLGEFYEETNKRIELAEKTVKKHKIGPKTLD